MMRFFLLVISLLSLSVFSEINSSQMSAYFAIQFQVASVDQINFERKVLNTKTICTKKSLVAKEVELGVIDWRIQDVRKYVAVLGADVVIKSEEPNINSTGDTLYADGGAFVEIIDRTRSPAKAIGRSPLGVSELNYNTMAASFPIFLSEDKASKQKLFLFIRTGSARFDTKSKETYMESFFKNEGEQAKLSLDHCENI